MILNDREIEKLCLSETPMLTPFHKLSTEGVISYGLSSFGYDAILSTEFKRYRNVKKNGEWVTVDPKRAFDDDDFEDFTHESEFVLPPHSFILGRTVETFSIPEDVFVICMGKSTYARCGIIVIVTPLEPGWTGTVTLEIYNTLDQPVKLYPNEGICQFIFYKGERPDVTYSDRKGKYQGQTGVTLPRIMRKDTPDPQIPHDVASPKSHPNHIQSWFYAGYTLYPSNCNAEEMSSKSQAAIEIVQRYVNNSGMSGSDKDYLYAITAIVLGVLERFPKQSDLSNILLKGNLRDLLEIGLKYILIIHEGVLDVRDVMSTFVPSQSTNSLEEIVDMYKHHGVTM